MQCVLAHVAHVRHVCGSVAATVIDAVFLVLNLSCLLAIVSTVRPSVVTSIIVMLFSSAMNDRACGVSREGPFVTMTKPHGPSCLQPYQPDNKWQVAVIQPSIEHQLAPPCVCPAGVLAVASAAGDGVGRAVPCLPAARRQHGVCCCRLQQALPPAVCPPS
jgi:hypothetical protein